MKKNTSEIVCEKCGEIFISRCQNKHLLNLCSFCYRAARREYEEKREQEKQKKEDEAWQKQSIEDKKRFEEELLKMVTLPIEEVKPKGATLYIIGNGFDLMHKVKSSYRAFRDFLGKKSELRFALELYLKSEDIWADFEEALGHIDMDRMVNPDIVGDMLDLTGFFEEDSGEAEYYMALEMAANPMRMMTEQLEKKFRIWVEKLEVETKERPLKNLFHDDKVLNFNYTEFVEELYHVSKSNICYIHGCRRKEKGYPKEKLILGHKPGATDQEYALIRSLKKKKTYRSHMIDLAQEGVIKMLSDYDESVTKDSKAIISAHSSFFESLTKVEDVVVIGHSVSPVDWDYFLEVAKMTPNARWYFGCHGIRDLENMQQLTKVLEIDPLVFRTDKIAVAWTPKPEKKTCPPKEKWKTLQSPEPNWKVQWLGRRICIIGKRMQVKRIMQENIRKCVFSPDGSFLFVVITGLEAGIPFFRKRNGTWVYIDELKSIPNQNLLNRRLQHIYLEKEKIRFVYNSRIREYSLENGELVFNQADRNAGNRVYEGQEMIREFF